MRMKKLSAILLAAAMVLGSAVSPVNSLPTYAAETKATPAYNYPETVTVNNGEGFLNASEQVSKFAGATSFTFNTTFTLTGTAVNALFFIGDSTKASNYASIYVTPEKVGVETKNAAGANQLADSVAVSDLTKGEHKLTFVVTGKSSYAFYFDGEKIKSGTTGVDFVNGVIAAPDFMGFGKGSRANGQNNYPFTGTMKDIEVYTTALSEAEILEYHAEKEREDLVYSYENAYYASGAAYAPITEADAVAALKALEQGTITIRYRAAAADNQLMSLFSLSDSANAGKYLSFYVNPSANSLGVEVMGGTGAAGNYAITPANTGALNTNGLNDTEWHTLAVTKAKTGTGNSGYQFFLDGKYLNQFSNKNGFLNGIDTANAIGIGFTDRASGNEYKFTGGIDSVKVYSSVLSDAEIVEEHNKIAFESTMVDDPSVTKTEEEMLFYPGYDKSGYYRIPSLLRTEAGTVIAATDRRNTGTIDYGNLDTTLRRREAGQTEFGDPIEVIDPIDTNHGMPSAFTIDPSMLQVKTGPNAGRIYMLVDFWPSSWGLVSSGYIEAGSGYTEINGTKYQTVYNYNVVKEPVLDAKGNQTLPAEYEEFGTIREGGVVYDMQGNATDYKVITKCEAPYRELGNVYKNGVYQGNIYMFDGEHKAEIHAKRVGYLWLTYSDDDGKTWSQPVDLNAQVKEDWMVFLGVGPGIGIQFENGRLAFPIYTANRNVGASQASALLLSDDYGKTWTISQSPVALEGKDPATMNSGTILTESQVVQLNNGDVKLFMRCYGGRTRMATSTNNGKTWDKIEILDDVYNSYCQLSVVHYTKEDGTERVMLVTPGADKRRDGTAYMGTVQEDGSFTWQSKLLYPGHFQYSSIAHLGTEEDGDELFGVLFEADVNGVDGQIAQVYTEFDESWVTTPQIASTQEAPVLVNKEVSVTGTTMNIELTFDQVVMAAGNPRLNLTVGDKTFTADYVSGSATDTLIFEATVPNGAEGVVKATGVDETAGYLENTTNGKAALNDEVLYDLTKVQSGMQVVAYSSQHSDSTEEGVDGAASNVLDGNPKTYWHSKWGAGLTLPQWLKIDLGAEKNIYKMSYVPRNGNGKVKDYEIWGSTTGTDDADFTLITEGTFIANNEEQFAEFVPTDVRYIKFVVKTSTATDSCAVAELGFFEYADGAIENGDKTRLTALVNSMADLTAEPYSTASWEKFAAAKAKAEALLAAETVSQTMLDNAYDALFFANRELVEITPADETLETVEGLVETDYTPESWAAFQEFLTAYHVTEKLNAATTKKEVQDIIAKIEAEMAKLEAPAETGTISGTVTAGEEPLVGAGVYYTLAGGTDTKKVNTGLDGTYTIPDLPYGEYELRFTKPGYSEVTATVTISAETKTVTKNVELEAIPEEKGTLSGVVKEGETPLAGVTVTVTLGDVTKTATTDDTGAYSIADLAYGEYSISFAKEGYETVTETVTVNAEAVTKDAVLEAVPEEKGTVSGTVTTLVEEVSTALEGVTVTVTKDGAEVATATTGADGTYSIADLVYGEYSISFAKEGYTTVNETVTVNAAAVTKDAVLTVVDPDHTHEFGTEWKSDAKNHWHECACGEKSETAAHTFGEWTTVTEATEEAEGSKERTCSVCEYKETESIPKLDHTFGTEWKSDKDNHWHECACGEKSETAAHTFGEWTTVTEATEETEGSKERTCSVCEYKETESIPKLDHTFGTEWKSDKDNHWHECACGEKADAAAHTYGEWKVTKPATEAEAGVKEHTCTVCGYKETAEIPKLDPEEPKPADKAPLNTAIGKADTVDSSKYTSESVAALNKALAAAKAVFADEKATQKDVDAALAALDAALAGLKEVPAEQPGDSSDNNTDNNTGSNTGSSNTSNVAGAQTGDTTNVTLWTALLGAAILGMMSVVSRRKRS